MAGTKGGQVTTAPATSFVKDGKRFVRFSNGGVVEVYGPAEFEAEHGMTFTQYCEMLQAQYVEPDQVGKVKR